MMHTTMLGAVAATLLIAGLGHSADPPATPKPPAEASAAPSPATSPPMRSDGLPVGSVTSPWMEFSRPDCCGPLGGGPIGSEFYLRTGPSMPVSNGILHDTLDTGWMTQIGARSLFFDPGTTKAWTVDGGLSFTINNSGASNVVYAIPLPVNTGSPLAPNIVVQDVNVTTRDYQRWSFNLAAGRDWYLWRPAYDRGWHWRMGWDIGGRWGYSRLGLNDLSQLPARIGYRHVGDVYGAFAAGIHEDIEIPLRNCISFIMGVRAEWVYNWTDIVPANVGRDLQDVNILLNFGWRF